MKPPMHLFAGTLAGVIVLWTLACSDGKHPWSISDAAVESLDLEQAIAERVDRDEKHSSGCQQLVQFDLDGELNLASASVSELRDRLLSARKVEVECRGSCSQDLSCRPHHRLSLADSNYGETTCTCHPSSPSACRLVVGWGVGPSDENRIERIYCESEGSSDQPCGLILHERQGVVRISCEHRQDSIKNLTDSVR